MPSQPVSSPPAQRSVWRAGLVRHLAVMSGLCLGIAALLTALDGGGFGSHLVYSVAIGAVCTLVIKATRLGVERLWLWRCQLRGLPATKLNPWLGVVLGAVLALGLGPSLGLSIGDALTGYKTASILNLGNPTVRFTLVISVLGLVLATVVLSTFDRLQAARVLAEQAQRLAAETELRLLQSQLEPHMLFNTLANLRVLVGTDAVRAQTMLDHLIAYLRSTLNASRTPLHPLATEFDRLADYLALMAVRMGPRLQVALDLPAELGRQSVPPLLLQPLVENAIKHGLEPQVAGGRIEVSARQRRGAQGVSLRLQVRDTGVGLQTAPSPGKPFGLELVRQRLATLYGEAARFELNAVPEAEGGGTLATIDLPLQNPSAAALANVADVGPAPDPAPDRQGGALRT